MCLDARSIGASVRLAACATVSVDRLSLRRSAGWTDFWRTSPRPSVGHAARTAATSARSCSAARSVHFFHVQLMRRGARPTVLAPG